MKINSFQDSGLKEWFISMSNNFSGYHARFMLYPVSIRSYPDDVENTNKRGVNKMTKPQVSTETVVKKDEADGFAKPAAVPAAPAPRP